MDKQRGQAEIAAVIFLLMLAVGLMCLYLGIARPEEVAHPNGMLGIGIFIICFFGGIIALAVSAAARDRGRR